MAFPKFIRLSDNAVVTEADIDPGMIRPSPYFRPNPDSGYELIETVAQPASDHTESVEEDPPELVEGKWKQKWRKRAATAEEAAARRQEKAKDVRAKRDERMAATDWTQLLDAPPAAQAAHVAYRQALRDVPQQPGFPFTVTWPVKP